MFPLVYELAAAGARIRVPVAVTCRVLGFSKQAYYQWRNSPVSQRDWNEAHLVNAAREVHRDDPGFGYRFIADELAEQGFTASERRVWRVCSRHGIFSVFGKKPGRAPKAGPPVHDDLVQRTFTSDSPDRLWLSDITEHATAEGELYLCAVKDVFSNRIVGYSIDSRMKSRLAVAALTMAVARRNPVGTVVHSDRGSLGGFNRLSQHLVIWEVFGGSSTTGRGSGTAAEAEVAWPPEVSASCRGGVLGTDRQGAPGRGSGRGGRRGAGGGSAVVPQRWRYASI